MKRRLPWWGWTLAGCGGLALVLVLGVAAVIGWQFIPHRTDYGERCTTTLGMKCERVHPEVIARLTQMRLPVGTTVHESQYESFQDWRVRARFSVPADRVAEWEQSLAAYPPAGTTDCTELTGEGTDRRCASANDPQQPPIRTYTRVTRPDSSVLIEVEAFTT